MISSPFPLDPLRKIFTTGMLMRVSKIKRTANDLVDIKNREGPSPIC